MRQIILMIMLVNMWGFVSSSPQITFVKTGEESVRLGKFVTYSITIKNHSNTPISSIVIKDMIPAGFKYRQRNTGKFALRWNIKTLAGNTERSFKYVLQTTQPGKFTSRAHLYIGGKKNNTVHFTTTVMQPKISVDIRCPSVAVICKLGIRLTITLKNTGNMNLSGVVLKGTDSPFGSDYQIVRAEGNPMMTDITTAIWNVGFLAIGETKSYSLTVACKDYGQQCFAAIVDSDEGVHAEAVCCTSWFQCGRCSFFLEVIDTVDPLTTDEETTYIIEVTNQGTQTQYNVKIEAVFPPEISPISAKGDTKCTVSGKRVTVTLHRTLNPKEKIKWEIRAKAVQPGDGRLRVYMSSKQLYRPVAEEESTHVY